MNWTTIYHLKNNTEYLNDIQKASLDLPNAGIQNTHGLVGSRDWWQNIENGVLKVFEIRGMIDECIWTGHGDFPEFILKDKFGKKTQWVRFGDPSFYKKGMIVILKYVVQVLKYNNANTNIVIEILTNLET